MEHPKRITHTTKEWEDALPNSREGIEYTLMNLDHGKVTSVVGIIRNGEKQHNAFWTSAGHCHIHGRRAKVYDIKF